MIMRMPAGLAVVAERQNGSETIIRRRKYLWGGSSPEGRGERLPTAGGAEVPGVAPIRGPLRLPTQHRDAHSEQPDRKKTKLGIGSPKLGLRAN